MIYKRLFILLAITLGCNKKYDQEACNDLSMKKFRGFTDAKIKFQENCMNFEIKYTQEVCHEALMELIQTGKLSEVKKRFGDPVEGCFTEQDIQKFTK